MLQDRNYSHDIHDIAWIHPEVAYRHVCDVFDDKSLEIGRVFLWARCKGLESIGKNHGGGIAMSSNKLEWKVEAKALNTTAIEEHCLDHAKILQFGKGAFIHAVFSVHGLAKAFHGGNPGKDGVEEFNFHCDEV
jgi:hypothetical protein